MHESVTFEISADLLAALKLGAEDLGHNIRLIAAIASSACRKSALCNATRQNQSYSVVRV